MPTNKLKISIIGLGYVGLPLALEFGKYFHTFGFDVNKKRISQLKKKIDINNESKYKDFIKSKNLIFTNNIKNIKSSDFYIITLPTPINSKKQPDTTIIKNSLKKISLNIKINSIIILESTVYPGFTEEVCVPIIEKYSNLRFNKDFFMGYSPERINPGDKKHQLRNISKIISASNKFALTKIENIYSKIIDATLHKTDNIKIAEAAKVIENTQRDLNIAFVNELSLIFDKMNISTNKVLEAASTKWNFLNFKPGLVGGHCIGVDPYYLTYKSKKLGFKPKIILAGRKLNDEMHKSFSKIILKNISLNKINRNKAKALILGVTFKENCSDIRNTKVINLINYLKDKINIVDTYDPLVNKKIFKKEFNISLIDNPKNQNYDVLILTVPHNRFIKNPNMLNKFLKKDGIIFDLKGALKDLKNIKKL